jgi:hypothetical protein
MQPLLIAVCVPKGGKFDLKKIQAHTDGCICRRRHPLYRVRCYEYEIPRQDDMVEDRAHECAQAALIVRPDAVIGVGLDWGSKVFYHKKRPIITPVAAAVLITRPRPAQPQLVVITHNDESDYSKQLLELCQQQGFQLVHHGQKCLVDRAIFETLRG